jgi:hypothetical protein
VAAVAEGLLLDRSHRDLVPPVLVLGGNPVVQGGSSPTFDDVEQRRPAVERHDSGGEGGAGCRGGGQERGLIHAEGVHAGEPAGSSISGWPYSRTAVITVGPADAELGDS